MNLREKFELLLELYRKEDGTKWTGADFHRATEGYLNRGYISNFRKGRIDQPRHDKLQTIAGLMDFDPQLWFQEPEQWPKYSQNLNDSQVFGSRICDRLNHLFDVIPNEKTGKPFTDEEVASRSRGRLSESDVRDLRECQKENPTVEQLLALSEVFRIDQSYWFLSQQRGSFVLDDETARTLADKDTREFLTKSLNRLSREDKVMLFQMAERMSSNRTDSERDGD